MLRRSIDKLNHREPCGAALSDIRNVILSGDLSSVEKRSRGIGHDGKVAACFAIWRPGVAHPGQCHRLWIFIVPAMVLQMTGLKVGLALLVWVLGGILSLLGALTYAELAAMKPEAGGLYI
jgi:hypothetical protein